MVLKSVYEIALSYGYEYRSDEEKIFILKIIEAAMCDEDEFMQKDAALNSDIHGIVLNGDFIGEGDWNISKEDQMEARRGGFVRRNDIHQVRTGIFPGRNGGRHL